MWEFNDMKVIDGFVSLGHRKAGVNNDEDLRGKIYFDAAVNEPLQMEEEEEEPVKEEEPNDEDFERLLKEFINHEFEEGGETPKDDDTPETDEPTSEESEDDPPENIVLPDGEIEQNGTISVKVRSCGLSPTLARSWTSWWAAATSSGEWTNWWH